MSRIHMQIHKNKEDYGLPGVGGDRVTNKRFRVSLRQGGVMKMSETDFGDVQKCG